MQRSESFNGFPHQKKRNPIDGHLPFLQPQIKKRRPNSDDESYNSQQKTPWDQTKQDWQDTIKIIKDGIDKGLNLEESVATIPIILAKKNINLVNDKNQTVELIFKINNSIDKSEIFLSQMELQEIIKQSFALIYPKGNKGTDSNKQTCLNNINEVLQSLDIQTISRRDLSKAASKIQKASLSISIPDSITTTATTGLKPPPPLPTIVNILQNDLAKDYGLQQPENPENNSKVGLEEISIGSMSVNDDSFNFENIFDNNKEHAEASKPPAQTPKVTQDCEINTNKSPDNTVTPIEEDILYSNTLKYYNINNINTGTKFFFNTIRVNLTAYQQLQSKASDQQDFLGAIYNQLTKRRRFLVLHDNKWIEAPYELAIVNIQQSLEYLNSDNTPQKAKKPIVINFTTGNIEDFGNNTLQDAIASACSQYYRTSNRAEFLEKFINKLRQEDNINFYDFYCKNPLAEDDPKLLRFIHHSLVGYWEKYVNSQK